MRKTIYVFLSTLSLSCYKKEEKSIWDDFYTVPYIIPEKERRLHTIIDSINQAYEAQSNGSNLHSAAPSYEYEILPPFPLYRTKDYGSGYGNLNIIFFKDKIYTHSKRLNLFCRSYSSPPPEDEIDFINLQPDDITEIHKDSIFLIDIRKSKLNSLDTSYHFVTISSLSDTIINPLFNRLTDSVRKINPYFQIRKISEEEYHVLDAKIANVTYKRENYKWIMNYGYGGSPTR